MLNNSRFERICISIYPNPFTDIITIQSEDEILMLQMFDALGKRIEITTNSNKINTTNLKSGMYFLKVEGNNSIQIFKLIKD